MRRMKALIKMELRPALFVLIYFMIINIISFVQIGLRTGYANKRNLVEGISGFMQMNGGADWGDMFITTTRLQSVAAIIGVCLFIYISYRNDKDHEVGRFLKSLPYTMKERYLVKIGMGIAVLSITYIVYGIGLMLLRANYIAQLGEVYEVTILSSIYKELLPSSMLLQMVVVTYMLVIACYLFIVMFEYLVSPNFASIVIACLVACSPAFILENLGIYTGYRFNLINQMIDYYGRLIVGLPLYGDVTTEINTLEYLGRFAYFNFAGLKLCIYLGIALICFIVTLKLCQKSYLEQSDIFIPVNIFRIIFILGVTICGSMLGGDLYMLLNDYVSDINIGNLVGMILSLMAAYKIAFIGIKKGDKKESKEALA